MARRLCTIVGLVGLASALALLSAPPAVAAPTQPQTITFTSDAPEGADWWGDAWHVLIPDYVASASASSGLPVTYSIDSASADVCEINEDFSPPGAAGIYFQGPGTCTIHADQAGDDEYLPAEQASQSFVLDKVQPTMGVLRESSWAGRRRTFRATLMVPTWYNSHSYGPWGYPGQVVTFSVSGQPVCSGTTDNSGVATCTAILDVRDWLKRTFTATYAGNALYKPVSRKGPTIGDRNPTYGEF